MRRHAETLRLAARARRQGRAGASPVGMTSAPPLVADIPTARHLSLGWRLGDSASLRRRRRAATTSLSASCLMAGLSLYQMGVIGRLPELPHRAFDANTVDASAQAYQLGGMPDATLGVVSYGMTAALAAAGGMRPPAYLSLALVAKAGIDVAWALKLTADQAFKHRVACSWCLAASALSLSTLGSAAGEARAAWRQRS